jgi:hypothetical protein
MYIGLLQLQKTTHLEDIKPCFIMAPFQFYLYMMQSVLADTCTF